MSDDLILTHQSGAVRTLTLNRPQALNSFTGEMHAQLLAALDAVAADASVRCVVLTGAGRGFCAGQDLADPSVAPDTTPGAAPKDLGQVIERFYRQLVQRLRASSGPERATPVIALTADVVTKTPDEYLALGFNDFLAKPILVNGLMSSVMAAVGERYEGHRAA